MELQVGDLVQHLAGIPDHGAGVVLEQYVSEPSLLVLAKIRRGGSASIPNPYREVRVLWQHPLGYVSWVGNHQLERINAEGKNN